MYFFLVFWLEKMEFCLRKPSIGTKKTIGKGRKCAWGYLSQTHCQPRKSKFYEVILEIKYGIFKGDKIDSWNVF